MAFALKPGRHVGRNVKRAARERLDDALARLDHLDGCTPDEIEAQVHEIRKRCKESRGLARLVEPALGPEFGRFNRHTRDAASELASIRDAHAILGVLEHLLATSDQGLAALESARDGQAVLAARATGALRPGDPRLSAATRLLAAARRDVRRWDLPKGFAPIRSGLGATYRRGRLAYQRAARGPSDDAVHEWRKAVKQLWYQIRLLEPAAPSVLGPLTDVLDDLSDQLGDDHDLAILVAHLAADPDQFGGAHSIAEVERVARARQDELRTTALRLGATVYAEPRRAFVDRLAGYWELTLDHGPERPSPDDAPAARSAAGLERERKFVVTDPPELPAGTLLRQGYLAIDGSVTVRVRDAGPAGCTLTVKAGVGATRFEFEWPIGRTTLDELWDDTAGRRVSKTRSVIPLGGRTAEVDVFHNELAGLVVAEVEFDDEASMSAFSPPPWFGAEVSDDLRYTNASLAIDGLDPRLFGGPQPA